MIEICPVMCSVSRGIGDRSSFGRILVVSWVATEMDWLVVGVWLCDVVRGFSDIIEPARSSQNVSARFIYKDR